MPKKLNDTYLLDYKSLIDMWENRKIKRKLKKNVDELQATLNSVKDNFFEEFEKAHAEDIEATYQLLLAKKAELKNKTITTELDIRGFASDEGLMEVDRFLDEAVLGGVETVTIIHGKGTGILRKGIHEMLKKHRYVKSYRLGTFGEGEDGITVVELK